MINVSIAQLLSIWSDLDDAYYGEASHGDTVEILMLRLSPRDLVAEYQESHSAGKFGIEELAVQTKQARESLCNILEHFSKSRNVDILVDGVKPSVYVKDIKVARSVYPSVNVKVIRRAK